jgi:hypothetical protein
MMNQKRIWTKQGRANVLEQYRSGIKKSDIARTLGLSHQRDSEIIRQAESEEREMLDRQERELAAPFNWRR